ncbi:uncharacterized protein LOC143298039 [Babylonia areolata]|uniref:uncharacterized protein LOC143298039 n=1 Tax=Babylonia areolata TaxID=304850 RepID=UPI003FD05B7B
MKAVAVFLVLLVAYAYGQFFCPDSQANFQCFENDPDRVTCMKTTGTNDYSYACGYCGVKNETCFGNKEEASNSQICAQKGIANPC